MDITIDDLLGDESLRLRLGSDPRLDEAASRARRRAPLDWAHSSDLVDPSEFLGPGTLLLTDGSQFAGDAGAAFDYDAYVERLLHVGVLGLGFATQFLHDGVPNGLMAACAERGFPLLEVPDRVPFIAIIRRVAESLILERTRSLEQSAEAQQAISVAALRPDGVTAILHELETRLACRTALYDADGELLLPGRVASDLDARASGGVRELLRRDRRAARTVAGEPALTLQTLGMSHALRGVLVIEHPAPLGSSATALVTSVIGLATLALEQRHALNDARATLAAAVLNLLLVGQGDAADRIASSMWQGLPDGAMHVVVASLRREGWSANRLPEPSEALGRHLLAVVDEQLVAIVEADRLDVVLRSLADAVASVGVSANVTRSRLADAYEQARVAERLARGAEVVHFPTLAQRGVIGLLHDAGGEVVARRVLEPLARRDRDEGTALIATLEAWFEADCSWQVAADALGVHRHTLRNRIRAAGATIGADLESMQGRLEVWSALRLVSVGSLSRSGGTRG